jgi:Flp pilus assembly protein TadD
MEDDMKIALMIVAAALVPATASAQPSPYNDPAPGAKAILQADYSTAEREISAGVTSDDPARLINLGVVFAQTGRAEAAEQAFQKVLRLDDMAMVLADGHTESSHDVAGRALSRLHSGGLGR